MNVPGLTRENVASHLQVYLFYIQIKVLLFGILLLFVIVIFIIIKDGKQTVGDYATYMQERAAQCSQYWVVN